MTATLADPAADPGADPGAESTDVAIARIARSVRTIAVVGLSPHPDRPSWGVARYLLAEGFRVIPVNPRHAGETILDQPVLAGLGDIADPAQVDMVDIFRRSDAVGGIVDTALARLPGLSVIWTQLGVRDDAAAARARAAGVTMIQDRCPKIEFPRFLGRGGRRA